MSRQFSLIVTLVLCYLAILGDSKNIGIFYGDDSDHLPDPKEAVKIFKQHGIGKIRLFMPNPTIQEALRGSNIDLMLGVPNSDIPKLAGSLKAAEQWFVTYVQPYVKDVNFSLIPVGNEVVPGQFSESIVPAIRNLQNVFNKHNLKGTRVTTIVNQGTLATKYPPSAAKFSEASMPFMKPILQQLKTSGAPLLINVYPYYWYATDPSMRLDYVQFTTKEAVLRDGNLSYTNLFDAMVDSFVWAMEKVGMSDVRLVVSESGWPHAGNGKYTTVDLARTYNKNFMNHLLGKAGTPKRPGVHLDGYIASMLDEDLRPKGIYSNFGMFKLNLKPNYDIFT